MPILNPQAAFDAALQHYHAGRFAEAESLCRQLLLEYPDHPDPPHVLGAIALNAGRLAESVQLFRRAVAINSAIPIYHNSLGAALILHGQIDQAITSLQTAIRLQPNMAAAHMNLGMALLGQGRVDDAIASLHVAEKLDPTDPEIHNHLGNALRDAGQLDAGIESYRRALAIEPGIARRHSNLCYILLSHPACAPEASFDEHRRFSRQHAGPLRQFIPPHLNDRSPDRRLRIGYVSPDFRAHSLSFFLEPLLSHHNPDQVETFCYADLHRPDDVTARLRRSAHHWRDITSQADAQVANLISQNDRIDILVDLAGHTSGNRLSLFARKPAPVQVTYLGYPATTGLDAIDYRLTDAWADPPGMTESHHSEQLIRLPDTFLCYRPPDSAPPGASAPPALGNGQITFGSFNALHKINAPLVGLWSRILQQCPESRLLIKASGLDGAASRQRLFDQFSAAGIDPGRLEVRGKIASESDHLRLYDRIDLALDTFPYHGTTTTCEALWMGVPVLTLTGQTHVSRVGVSILTNVGLPELAAQSPDEYVAIATSLAGNLPRLAELRSTLRQRMRASPLMDAARFARNVEAAYRRMWHTWVGAR